MIIPQTKCCVKYIVEKYLFLCFLVGPKSGGSSDTSPPLQSFAEESSPENLMPSRMVNGQSTESLDSLSDESGGVHPHHPSRSGNRHNRSASGADLRNIRNPVPPPRQVIRNYDLILFVKISPSFFVLSIFYKTFI